MVVLMQLPSAHPGDLRELGTALWTRLGSSFPELSTTVGFGDSYAGAVHIPRAYTQACEARDARVGAGRDTHVRLFSDLGPRIRSLENQTPERLEYFVQSTLGPLLVRDRERNDHLVASLHAYLEADRNVARAAAGLYVHPNTLRNKLRRVEELLGVDLEETNTLVDLALGFQALRMAGRT